MLKIVVFCPENVTDKIINAMADAGAGVIGNYTHNAFILKGYGNWYSGEGSNPSVGEVGKMSREPEDRIETVCPEDKINLVMEAIKKVHPYETPAIDVYKLDLII